MLIHAAAVNPVETSCPKRQKCINSRPSRLLLSSSLLINIQSTSIPKTHPYSNLPTSPIYFHQPLHLPGPTTNKMKFSPVYLLTGLCASALANPVAEKAPLAKRTTNFNDIFAEVDAHAQAARESPPSSHPLHHCQGPSQS